MELQKAIENYKSTHLPDLEDTKNFFASLSLQDAVFKAATAMDKRGKMYGHQRRVGRQRTLIGACKLKKLLPLILTADSFEEIFQITELVKHRTKRLGDLWSYDTSLRIAFNRNFSPKEVYVQAGVVKGVAKALPNYKWNSRSLPLTVFPAQLQALEPYQIENFLCIWGKEIKTDRRC